MFILSRGGQWEENAYQLERRSEPIWIDNGTRRGLTLSLRYINISNYSVGLF